MSLIKTAQRNDKAQPTRSASDKQEKAVAKAVGGKQTANSGATMFNGKSDVSISGLFNIECKTKMTQSESISVKHEWLLKNERESLFDGRPYSAVAINFGPNTPNYYIINEELFETLVDYLKTVQK